MNARRRANMRLRAARRCGFSRPALGRLELKQSIGTQQRTNIANMIYVLLGEVGLQVCNRECCISRMGSIGVNGNTVWAILICAHNSTFRLRFPRTRFKQLKSWCVSLDGRRAKVKNKQSVMRQTTTSVVFDDKNVLAA